MTRRGLIARLVAALAAPLARPVTTVTIRTRWLTGDERERFLRMLLEARK